MTNCTTSSNFACACDTRSVVTRGPRTASPISAQDCVCEPQVQGYSIPISRLNIPQVFRNEVQNRTLAIDVTEPVHVPTQ